MPIARLSIALSLAAFATLSPAIAQQPIVLKASTIFDGKGHVLKRTNIVVEGDKIARLDPHAKGSVYDLRWQADNNLAALTFFAHDVFLMQQFVPQLGD